MLFILAAFIKAHCWLSVCCNTIRANRLKTVDNSMLAAAVLPSVSHWYNRKAFRKSFDSPHQCHTKTTWLPKKKSKKLGCFESYAVSKGTTHVPLTRFVFVPTPPQARVQLHNRSILCFLFTAEPTGTPWKREDYWMGQGANQ